MSAPRTREQELIRTGVITEQRACLSKKPFSKNDAQHQIKIAARRGVTLARYKCPFCEFWHTKSVPQE